MVRAAFLRRAAIPALVLLIAVAAAVLALHGYTPFGAPPPASQTDSGVAPVLARALWSVLRGSIG